MLFNYRYVSHRIEKFQTWFDHLVKVVWCRNGGAYSLDLLHADLRAVVEEIANDDRIRIDYLDGPIKAIDARFQNQLTAVQRAQVSLWYDHNNDVEALCGNDPLKVPCTYADIGAINSDLEQDLKGFCKSLFTDIIHLKAVTRRTAEIENHYDSFVAVNDEGKCPYCGYVDIKGQHHSKREAYDHFLPKSTYPFNSVNFRNLAPMCHECNSSYKLQKDPVRHIDPIRRKTGVERRKAFYSYATTAPNIFIELTLSTADIDKLNPSDITVVITAPGRDEELESWKEVFGIEERYRAKCCGKNDGKAWIQQIIEECANHGQSSNQLLAQVVRAAERAPYDSANFLKKSFLLACRNADLI
jgi:hypothetical protein